MHTNEPRIVDVLARFSAAGAPPTRVKPLRSAGGFSGSSIWRIETPAGDFGVKRWPRSVDGRRLAFIHATLVRVADRGIDFVPVPIRADDGATCVQYQGDWWEVTPWMPGCADSHERPTDVRIAAAMRALAKFHLAVAESSRREPSLQPSPTLYDRWQLLDQWRRHDVQRLRQVLAHRHSNGIARGGEGKEMIQSAIMSRAHELLDHFDRSRVRLEETLFAVRSTPLPMQTCIRDIWRDHVLFTTDRVTGIVDFGAMRVDCVAVDLARLLGSLLPSDEASWERAMDIYESVRTLRREERAAVRWLDAAAPLLSGLNWVRWLLLEQRRFDDLNAVLIRLDEHIHRLRTRAATGLPSWEC